MSFVHVSIIIVHYNTPKETLSCLQSLSELATEIPYQVVVVDNGSTESFRLPKRFKDEPVVVVRSDSNLGFTGGNNLGTYYAIEQYDSDLVLYLNSDTVVHPDFLDHLVAAQADPQVGIVTPLIYFSPGNEFHQKSYKPEDRGSVIWYAGGFIDWLNLYTGHRGVDELDRGQFSHSFETEYATGCALMIKREVLEKITPFDKRYFLYYEDADLSLRALRAGYELRLVPESIIWHDNAGSSSGSGSALQQYYQTRNRLLFFFRFGNWAVRVRVLRFAVRMLLSGSATERLGAWHWMSMRFGKQPTVGITL